MQAMTQKKRKSFTHQGRKSDMAMDGGFNPHHQCGPPPPLAGSKFLKATACTSDTDILFWFRVFVVVVLFPVCYIHVSVHTYEPGHSIIRPLNKRT